MFRLKEKREEELKQKNICGTPGFKPVTAALTYPEADTQPLCHHHHFPLLKGNILDVHNCGKKVFCNLEMVDCLSFHLLRQQNKLDEL